MEVICMKNVDTIILEGGRHVCTEQSVLYIFRSPSRLYLPPLFSIPSPLPLFPFCLSLSHLLLTPLSPIGASITVLNEEEMTLLHYAVLCKQPTMVSFLLKVPPLNPSLYCSPPPPSSLPPSSPLLFSLLF